MKVLSKSSNNIPKEYKVNCPTCDAFLEFTQEDVKNKEYGYPYITCPECVTEFSVQEFDELNENITTENVEYPRHFYDFSDGFNISNEKIQEWINEVIQSLKNSKEDYGVFSVIGSGNTKIIGVKYVNEYDIIVTKNYKECLILRNEDN